MPVARAVDRVPVAPIRDAFERSGVSRSDVCRALGWMRMDYRWNRQTPDTSRLNRALGIVADHSRTSGWTCYRRHLNYETAVRIAHAIGLDPVDLDL